ncbi:MAG: DUF1997 domain-containing protein [Synechococcus sp. TMED20]|nr:MAG: DUF1997 domain-containing protein [Synechococcus sp. TMED20]
MPLAFDASQHLDLPVQRHAQRLADYLRQEERLLAALLDERQLTRKGPGEYRYLVTNLQVFQLQVKPIVSLQIEHGDSSLLMRAVDCELEGLGLVDDFKLTLEANLNATDRGLVGDASLAVRVSQPPLLRLIPKRMLETTGESLLNGILVGIKARVGQQLMADFRRWCRSAMSDPKTLEETTAVQRGGA